LAGQKRGSLFPLKQSIFKIIIKIKTILKLFIAQNKASDNLLSWHFIENVYFLGLINVKKNLQKFTYKYRKSYEIKSTVCEE